MASSVAHGIAPRAPPRPKRRRPPSSSSCAGSFCKGLATLGVLALFVLVEVRGVSPRRLGDGDA
jgi:hypothetical protein